MKVGRLAAATVFTAVVLACGASATAAEAFPPPVGDGNPAIAFDDLNPDFAYGDGWYANAVAVNTDQVTSPWTGTGAISGASADSLGVSTYWDSAAWTTSITLYPTSGGRPLPAGSYSLTASVMNGGHETFTVPQPARLTITPAKLGVEVRIAADHSNPRNAIITARFTGPFVESFAESWGTTSTPSAPLTPAGTWTIEVKNAGGTVVENKTIPRADTEDAFATSLYWLDAPAGDYTATAKFVTTGASSGNFRVTDGAPFPFTAPGPAPLDAPTASPAPTAPPVIEPAGSVLPLWIPAVAGLISAGLLALLIVQIVRTMRLRRAPAVPAAPGTEVAE